MPGPGAQQKMPGFRRNTVPRTRRCSPAPLSGRRPETRILGIRHLLSGERNGSSSDETPGVVSTSVRLREAVSLQPTYRVEVCLRPGPSHNREPVRVVSTAARTSATSQTSSGVLESPTPRSGSRQGNDVGSESLRSGHLFGGGRGERGIRAAPSARATRYQRGPCVPRPLAGDHDRDRVRDPRRVLLREGYHQQLYLDKNPAGTAAAARTARPSVTSFEQAGRSPRALDDRAIKRRHAGAASH